MPCHLSLNQLAQLLSLQDKSDISFRPDSLVSGINTDSRSLESGQAFLALKGDNFNGHDFNPKTTLTPYGIFIPEFDELFLYFTASTVTSDFIVQSYGIV